MQKTPWTADGLLTEFIADVRYGKIKPVSLMVFYVEADPEGRLRPHYWTQNVTVPEQIAFGELVKNMALEDWKS